MNIHSVLKSSFTPKALTGLSQRLVEHLPNITVNKEELCCDIGRFIARPDVGRGIMGVTAIMTQPLIDYYNPKVDKDTAKVSAFRTIGKILAGTAVGCGVRSLCYYGVRALTKLNPGAPAWRKILLPPESAIQTLSGLSTEWVKDYRSVLATFMGLVVMLGTNVLLDVPLTNMITKFLMKHAKPNEQPQNTNPQAPNEPVKPSHQTYDVNDKFRETFIDKFDTRNKWRSSL